jgi:hypothetical protein
MMKHLDTRNVDAVRIGDHIRFSVELIRDFATLPDFSSPVLVLAEVRIEPDGTKILTVSRLPEDVAPRSA